MRAQASPDVNGVDVQPVVLSGLAAGAVAEQAPPLLAALGRALAAAGRELAPPVVVDRGRLKAADEVALLRGARVVVALLGDRPGLRTPRSLSGYVTVAPRPDTSDAERSMVSNVHADGLSAEEAAQRLAAMVVEGGGG